MPCGLAFLVECIVWDKPVEILQKISPLTPFLIACGHLSGAIIMTGGKGQSSFVGQNGVCIHIVEQGPGGV
jgi:hypothetical protein